MQTVNYYDVLGVLPTADDFVIKAAYKALAQRYHPDKFHGNAKDAADAQVKMRQLNEAYQVLSDPAKRREYDISFQQGAQQNQHNSQQKSEQAKQQEDWAIALRFYPDLTELETRLGKIDPSLVSEFRSSLLASQQYEQRQRIASQIEQSYLEDYFGNDPKILECARDLLLAGHREVAKELNRVLKVVGGGVSSEKIIEQIEAKYFPHLNDRLQAARAYKQQQENSRKEAIKSEYNREQIKREGNWILLITILLIAIPIILFWINKDVESENKKAKQAEMQALERQQDENVHRHAQRYHDNQDGTVTDINTGLQWKRCAEGQKWTGNTCLGEAKSVYEWNDVIKLTSNFAGKKDWRLPTVKELNTLVFCDNGHNRKFLNNGYNVVENEGSYSCASNVKGPYRSPTINSIAFPNTPNRSFWSSAPSNNNSPWSVDFDSGGDGNIGGYYVRLVRSVR